MKKLKSWSDYYKNHHQMRISNIILHWPYLLSIWKEHPKRILEIGCGPADHSVFLSKKMSNTQFTLLDNDPGIVKWLKEKYANRFEVISCDITSEKDVTHLNFKKNTFDVVYSQGLMEHFEEKEFIKIIEHFLPYSKKTIFSVPSDKYPDQDFGNEILRTKKELADILEKIPGITYKVHSYFPDISLRTKLLRIKKFHMDWVDSILYLLFGSNHYLVEISKQ